MNQYPYGTSGICPGTKSKTMLVLVSNQAAMERKNSQYLESVTSMSKDPINYNACGLVALAGALYQPGSEQWLAVVKRGFNANGYSAEYGIQPKEYTTWVKSELLGTNLMATAANDQTLSDLQDALGRGEIVIVDISAVGSSPVAVSQPDGINNFAHFARILAIKDGYVTIENTLNGGNTWIISEADFLAAWGPNVEQGVNSRNRDDKLIQAGVNRWALYIKRKQQQ